MDIFLIVLGAILMIIGILGSVLPILPGPPLSFVGLLLLQFSSKAPFDLKFFIIWGVLTAIVVLLDYLVPIWGTKKIGGTKAGTRGATAGLILGLFIPPWGLIIGPFIGAFIGEFINSSDLNVSFKSALGSFVGFLAGTFMKLAVTIGMAFFFVKALF
ncbi:MAG: DUF456 domain-containing protein [Bacteroidales bacterium]|jgi:uncharacterized protein YqgC (DUF456 family)